MTKRQRANHAGISIGPMTATEFKRLREHGGWTLDALGALLGYHWGTMSRYENGHCEIPRAVAFTLRALARAKGKVA
jgi:transcriptional regulator with XRE-family HTH domain